MKIREGVIPTILGTAVTATGSFLKRRRVNPMISNSIFGFGLAHIALGAIDIIQHRNRK